MFLSSTLKEQMDIKNKLWSLWCHLRSIDVKYNMPYFSLEFCLQLKQFIPLPPSLAPQREKGGGGTFVSTIHWPVGQNYFQL